MLNNFYLSLIFNLHSLVILVALMDRLCDEKQVRHEITVIQIMTVRQSLFENDETKVSTLSYVNVECGDKWGVGWGFW
jgi:hypothetical protein